jgi:hypothetical protein
MRLRTSTILHLRSYQTCHHIVSCRSSDKMIAKFYGRLGTVCYICYIENSNIPSLRFWFVYRHEYLSSVP